MQVEPADDDEAAQDEGERKPQITPATARAFQVQLLTAQRPGEVRSMKWVDVDLENGWWSIPGAVAKNGQAHRVPLTKTVVDILKARLKAAGESAIFVFENRRGAGSVAHRGKKAASVLCKSMTFEFRAHDLRRTAATRMAEAGVPGGGWLGCRSSARLASAVQAPVEARSRDRCRQARGRPRAWHSK
jgi:integrase